MAENTISVQLEAYSWISAALGKSEPGRNLISRKIKSGTVLADFFKELAETFPEFSQKVYNSEAGRFTGRVMVIVNNRLIPESEFASCELNNQDKISLSPILVGG